MGGFQGLTVILPAVNETTSLKKTVDEIFLACDSADLHELILATADFATPACRAVCDEIQKNCGAPVPVRVYVQTGPFEEAIRDLTALLSGSHFIYQPTDLEEDPRLLAEVIRLAKLHPDAVISGSRKRSQQGFSGFFPAKRALYGVWRVLFSALYGGGVTDSTLLYRCMPSAPAKRVILNAKSYAVLFELFVKLLRMGVPVVEFPVEMGRRAEGASSTRFLADGLRYAGVLVTARFTPVGRFVRPAADEAEKGAGA